MKKEIIICDNCNNKIGDSHKRSKVKNGQIELDICYDCTDGVIELLDKLGFNNYDKMKIDGIIYSLVINK